MIVSAELRWFWEGAVPTPLEHWFARSGFPPLEEPARDDVYLLDGTQPELGLKRRDQQGGVEVKGLVGRAERPLTAGPLSGHVEIWTKWTSDALRLDGLPSLVVRKVRRLRRFDAEGLEVGEATLESGCHLELTEVSIAGREGVWHTLGLEAFGTLDGVERNLERTLEHLIRREVPVFQAGVEQSYPAWLAGRGIG